MLLGGRTKEGDIIPSEKPVKVTNHSINVKDFFAPKNGNTTLILDGVNYNESFNIPLVEKLSLKDSTVCCNTEFDGPSTNVILQNSNLKFNRNKQDLQFDIEQGQSIDMEIHMNTILMDSSSKLTIDSATNIEANSVSPDGRIKVVNDIDYLNENSVILETNSPVGKINWELPKDISVVQDSNNKNKWILKKAGQKYTVTYEYTGEIPNDLPKILKKEEYNQGEVVQLPKVSSVDGYNFLGWNSDQIGAEMKMPAKDVKIVGTWSKNPLSVINKYSIKYKYLREVPENAPKLPEKKEYEEGQTVIIEEEPHMDVYEFSGWNTKELLPEMKMPGKDIEILGTWKKYNLKDDK